MAGRVRVVVNKGQMDRLRRVLSTLLAPKSAKIRRNFLLKASYAVLIDATTNQIIRGGVRGGKNSKPDPHRLTSRTGELRRSLSLNRGRDRSGLPNFIDVGSDLRYAAVHEKGGLFTRKSHTRIGRTKKLKRSILGPISLIGADRTIAKGFMRVPPRPFLAPAVAEASHQFEAILLAEIDKSVTEAAR